VIVAAGDWVRRIERGEDGSAFVAAPRGTSNTRAIAAGLEEGTWWEARDDGLYESQTDHLHTTELEGGTGLPSVDVQDVVADGDGRVWAATAGGLVERFGGRFRHWGAADGLPSRGASAVAAHPAGGVVAAAGLCVGRLPGDGDVAATSVDLGWVGAAVAADAAGTTGVATWYALARGRGAALRPVELPYDGLPGLAAVVALPDGRVLTGGWAGLFVVEPGGGVTRYTAAEGLPATEVVDLHVSGDGEAWVATTAGLARFVAAPAPCDGRHLGPAPCDTGLLGACAAGAGACEAGVFSCAALVDPGEESCDGTDEDCDGEVDEELPDCNPAPAPGPMPDHPAWTHLPGEPALQILRTELTQAQWWAVMGTSPSSFRGCADCPVEDVTWFDAVAFCSALSDTAGLTPCYVEDPEAADGWAWPELEACEGYRLPTGDEWETAGMAGAVGDYHNGRSYRSSQCAAALEDLGEIAWFNCNTDRLTHRVGGKTPNAWGLFDVHGNVSEWTWRASARSRGTRGGSYMFDARHCRRADINTSAARERFPHMGFRPVATAIP